MPETAAEREDRELSERVYQFPMHVELIGRARTARETEELLELAKAKAQSPASLDENPPFFFRATVSTTLTDSYGTHQMPSSLENFAEDLSTGVAFLASHAWQTLPMGHSLRGQMVRKKGDKPQRTWGDFFTVPDLNLNGINTNDFIRGTETGIIRDVSKGFYGGRWVCDICGNDYRRYGSGEGRCPHFLLEEYEVDGRGMVVCTVGVEDAHISEVSAVYDGAVPGAAIEKATRAIESGDVPPEKARQLSVRYRCSLPGTQHQYAGWSPADPSFNARIEPPQWSRLDIGTLLQQLASQPPNDQARSAAGRGPEETRMADKPAPVPEPSGDLGVLQALSRSIHEAFRDLALDTEGKEPATVVRALGAELTELRPLRDKAAALEARIATLEPQAKDGEAYRTAMVDATWDQFVRAGLAEGEDEAATRTSWGSTSLSLLLKEQERYRKLGDARFPGGRLTSDGEPGPNSGTPRGFVDPLPPAGAFRA